MTVDIFSDCFSFNIVKHKDAKVRAFHLKKLKNIYKTSKDNPSTVFIISDMSLKNNITTYVMYIQREQALITKAVHHAMNITSTKAKLFAIMSVTDT